MKKRAVGLFLALILLAAGLYPVHVLQIEAPRQEKIFFAGFLRPGDRFSLMYRHSVELSRVWDHFRINGEYRLVLDETVFSSSNTGLPSVLGPGERFARNEKTSRISNIQRIIPAVELWVDRRYDNILEIGGQKIFLPELAGDTLLRLRIRKTFLAEWAYREVHSFFNGLTRS